MTAGGWEEGQWKSIGMGQNGVEEDQHSGAGRRELGLTRSHTEPHHSPEKKLVLGWCELLATQKVAALWSLHGGRAAKRLGTATTWPSAIHPTLRCSDSNPNKPLALQQPCRTPFALHASSWTQVRGAGARAEDSMRQREGFGCTEGFLPELLSQRRIRPCCKQSSVSLSEASTTARAG